MKRLISYVKPYCGHVILVTVAGMGCSMANIKLIDMLKQLIDVTISGALSGILPVMLWKFLAVIAVGLLFNYLVVAMTGRLGAGLLRDLRKDTLQHIMKAAPDLGEKNNFGDMMERLSSDMETLVGYMQTYFKDCLYVPVIVVALSVYLFWMHPVLAVVCLLPLTILVPVSIIRLRPVKLAQAEYVRKLGLTNNNIREAFDGVEVIKAYQLEKTMEDNYYEALKETLDISNQNDLRQYHVVPISEMIRELPIALALCVGGYLVFQGSVTIGMLVAFVSAIQKLNEPLVNAYQLVVRTQMAMIAVNRVFYVMDLPMEAQAESVEAEKCGKELFCFCDVSFSYQMSDGSKRKILDGFNLVLEKGKKIAFVGASGSGKSTIVKLLCRQYGIDEGQIYYGGKAYGEIAPEAVRKDIALLSQEVTIFAMSVLDNIRIGNPDANREEIVRAAVLAGCDSFIHRLPQGYDTRLEERGSNLSGGQKQRIAIARAILKNADILVLDEPTSALDKDTEQQIIKTIGEITKDKTVLTVAHRLSTIMDYDEIIVMEEGRIAERGNHQQLMQQRGRYYRMFQEYMAGGITE